MLYSLIGIDVGSYLTKVVEMRFRRQPLLMNAAVFTTPYSKDKAEEKEIDERELFNLIVNNIGLGKLKDFQIGIAVSSSFVRAEVFTLPQMSAQELKLAVVNEARRKMVPVLEPEKAIFDHLLLGRKIVEDTSQLEALVVRCEKEEIEKKVGFFEKQGLPLNLITATPFALVNLLPENFWKGGENIAFIHIGALTTDIFIARERKIRFFRNIAFGVNEIISDISRLMKISWEEAFQRLYEYGIPPLSDFTAKDRTATAKEIMQEKYEGVTEDKEKMIFYSHIERIITELRRSFIYYREQEKTVGGIEKIFFSGGGSQIKNLVSEIGKRIGGICSVFDPFQYVKLSQKREIPRKILIQGPLFSIACGLALTLRVKERERINFLPLPLKKRKKVSIIRTATLLTSGFLFFLFLVGYANLFFTARSLKFSLLEQKAQLESLAPLLDEESKFRQLSKRIRGVLSVLESLEKQSVSFDQILIQLAHKVPEKLTLSSLYFQSKEEKGILRWKMELKGYITADYETACKILENFKDNLQDSGIFKNISSSSLELETVTPVVADKDIVLTEIKKREFNLTADLEVSTK